MSWEHKRIHVEIDDMEPRPDTLAEIDARAVDGWELVCVSHYDSKYPRCAWAYYRRQRVES